MVSVKGTKGNTVSVQILGLAEVSRMLAAAGHDISVGADLGVIKAATFIQEEVKESILGNRAEPKSVDSGEFVKTVKVVKISKGSAKVQNEKRSYPGSSATTQDVALILEKGTSKISPRMHYKNTEIRNAKKIVEIVDSEVKAAL